MEVRRLRLLREFADRGSVGAVAAALHMTPSAVSQQLKVLADEAGVELLEPDGRGIRLTDAGHALVLRADDVIAAVDRAAEEMLAYRSGNATVRLGMFPSGSTLLLPERVAAKLSDGMTAGEVLIPSDDVAFDIVRRHAAGPDAFVRAKAAEFAAGDAGRPRVPEDLLAMMKGGPA